MHHRARSASMYLAAQEAAGPCQRSAAGDHPHRCEYTYVTDALVVCPERSHEWDPAASGTEGGAAVGEWVVKDAVGEVPRDGDFVVVVEALR